MVWRGQRRAPIALPREPQARVFHLGGGMQGPSKEGRKESRQQGRDRKEPAAHPSP